MGSWCFSNVGFICEKENIENVKKLLECMGIDFDKVHGTEDGEINDMFWNVVDIGRDNSDFQPEEIYTIVNKVFENTIILYESEEGNSISDWYSRFEEILDPKKNKIYCGEYDYCIGVGEDKEVSEWKKDFENIEIEKDKMNTIINNARNKGYKDIEKLIIDVIINGNKSPYNNSDEKKKETDVENAEFVIQGGLLLEYKGGDEVVIIPEGVNAIHKAFKGNKEIREVIIPEGVIRIGEESFAGCYNLEKITIPKSVNRISKAAFCCTGFKSIELPEGITEIAKDTFMVCDNLKEITIPKSVTKIGDYAFERCNSLKRVVILNSNVEISKHAFDDWMYEKGIIEIK